MRSSQKYLASVIALASASLALGQENPRTRTEYFARFGFDPSKLERFYQETNQLEKLPLDIVVLGDSLARGYGLPNPDEQAWPNLMGRALQSAWNPDGVAGGPGFLPARYTWNALRQPFLVQGGYATQVGKYMQATGGAVVRLNGSLNSPLSLNWTGSGVTSLAAVAYRMTMTEYHSNWSLKHGDRGERGKMMISHPSSPEIARITPMGDGKLDPASETALSIAAPGGAYVRLSGLLRYNGDEERGLRFQNLACSGNLLFDVHGHNGYMSPSEASGLSTFTKNVLDAHVNIFPRGKLVILGIGTNDQGEYGRTEWDAMTTGRAVFQRALFQLCRYLTNQGRAVILVTMPAPGANREGRYRSMVCPSISTVARTLPHVTEINFDRACGERRRNELPIGWDSGDQLHFSATAHRAFADDAIRLLLMGRG